MLLLWAALAGVVKRESDADITNSGQRPHTRRPFRLNTVSADIIPFTGTPSYEHERCRCVNCSKTFPPSIHSFKSIFSSHYQLTRCSDLPITNAASILGRLLPPLLSDTLGPLNVQIPCALISSLLLFVWLAVHSLGPLITLCLLYGFFSGGMLALPPASVASLTSDMRFFGGRMGVCFISMGIGSLVGTPVMGAIVGERGEGGNWVGGMVWGGVTIAVGGGLMGLGRWIVGRERRGKEEGRWVKV